MNGSSSMNEINHLIRLEHKLTNTHHYKTQRYKTLIYLWQFDHQFIHIHTCGDMHVDT